MKNETTINDRIDRIIYHYKLNKSSFSKAIGLKSSMTITNIVSGRRSKPSYEVLRRIVAHFPINSEWLLLGKGTMLSDSEEDTERDELEVDKVANAIVRSPEKYEKHPVFASYLDGKCAHAIVAHQDELLLRKSGKSDTE